MQRVGAAAGQRGYSLSEENTPLHPQEKGGGGGGGARGRGGGGGGGGIELERGVAQQNEIRQKGYCKRKKKNNWDLLVKKI